MKILEVLGSWMEWLGINPFAFVYVPGMTNVPLCFHSTVLLSSFTGSKVSNVSPETKKSHDCSASRGSRTKVSRHKKEFWILLFERKKTLRPPMILRSGVHGILLQRLVLDSTHHLDLKAFKIVQFCQQLFGGFCSGDQDHPERILRSAPGLTRSPGDSTETGRQFLRDASRARTRRPAGFENPDQSQPLCCWVSQKHRKLTKTKKS